MDADQVSHQWFAKSYIGLLRLICCQNYTYHYLQYSTITYAICNTETCTTYTTHTTYKNLFFYAFLMMFRLLSLSKES